MLNKVITDVNSVFGEGVCIGPGVGGEAELITVVGWNNHVPDQTCIGEGATIYPNITSEQWLKIKNVEAGEVLK